MTHRCTGLCGFCCLPRPTVDEFAKYRLPRGWRASMFVGPYMAR